MTAIRIRRVRGKRDIDAFAALPRQIYREFSSYVPPLDIIQRDIMNPAKNPYFQHGEAAFWLAEVDGKLAGRISAQFDTLENASRESRIGHFGCLAAVDNQLLIEGLVSAAEDWLRERKCSVVTGPFNLSINGESGLMVEGHQEQATFMVPWHPPYLAARVEAAGYRKVRDLHSFVSTDIDKPLELARRFAADATRMGITSRHARFSSIDKELDIVLNLFNDAWKENWGFVPMTREELVHMAKELKPLLLDECLSIIEIKGEPAAFALALPNLNEMSADLEGKLLPFGWAKIAWRIKRRKYTSGRLLLMGVARKYRDTPLGAGLALMTIEKMREGAHKFGVRSAEFGWVLDDNKPMLRMLTRMGARHYKTHRLYEKLLS